MKGFEVIMLAIRGKYRFGNIELEEPMPPEIECADLNIVVTLISQIAEKKESDDDPEEDRIWESYSNQVLVCRVKMGSCWMMKKGKGR